MTFNHHVRIFFFLTLTFMSFEIRLTYQANEEREKYYNIYNIFVLTYNI